MRTPRITILLLLLLVGCMAPQIIPPVALSPEIEILEEDTGWVQVKVSNVTEAGYKLHWGDSRSWYRYSDVIPNQEIYNHMYQNPVRDLMHGDRPWTYVISLLDPQENVVDETQITILPVVDCHLSLLGVAGRTITCGYWGRWGIVYAISWGDRFGSLEDYFRT